MSDIQKCLSAFAVATWAGGVPGIKLADEAVDEYLKPHIQDGTARDALELLLRAFENVRKENVVADAIRIDLSSRIRSLTMPVVAEAVSADSALERQM